MPDHFNDLRSLHSQSDLTNFQSMYHDGRSYPHLTSPRASMGLSYYENVAPDGTEQDRKPQQTPSPNDDGSVHNDASSQRNSVSPQDGNNHLNVAHHATFTSMDQSPHIVQMGHHLQRGHFVVPNNSLDLSGEYLINF